MVSVRAVVATDLVRTACESHKASPAVSVALGRALMGSVLLASGRDAGEKLQVRIQGTGPVGSIIAEANSALECRGFVGDAQADAATIPELVGLGETASLRVTRMHPFWKQPYTGTTALATGEIAEDLVQYLALSEQTPASMGLSVQWDNEANRVKHAEGWLITLLPGWDDATVGVVETNVQSFGRLGTGDGPRPEAICEHMMRELLGSLQMEEFPKFACSCSEDKLLTAVMMLGKTEVLKILKEKEEVEATCDWCGKELSVTPDQIRDHVSTEEGKVEVETRTASPRQLKLQEDEMREMPNPGTANWG